MQFFDAIDTDVYNSEAFGFNPQRLNRTAAVSEECLHLSI